MITTSNAPPHDWREARRLQAWSLHKQGWKQRTIAQTLGVSEGAVSQWLSRGRQAGVAGLRRVPAPGAPPRLDDDQRNQLLALLEQGAEAFGFRGQRWTGPRVAQLIRTHFGVTYHPRYIPSLPNLCCADIPQLRNEIRMAVGRLRHKTNIIKACFQHTGLLF